VKTIIFAFLFFLPLLLFSLSPQSVLLNNKAMEFYERGEYEEASRLFRQAVDHDPKHFLAHYNLACTLTLLKDQGRENSWEEIYHHLVLSVALSPSRWKRVLEDPDLQTFRRSFYFLTWAEKDLHDPAILKSALKGGRYRMSLLRGGMMHQGEMELKADGRFVLSIGELSLTLRGGWNTLPGTLVWKPDDRGEVQGYVHGGGVKFPLTPWGSMVMDDL